MSVSFLQLFVLFSGAQGEYAGLRVVMSYLESIDQQQRNVRLRIVQCAIILIVYCCIILV